ncbi:hypothetical protein C8R44DRAFT_726735 [Mycena epipterygia]|nr:hypothetical protein C8R44DRAFT_726735 [Mycena epipterygia]
MQPWITIFSPARGVNRKTVKLIKKHRVESTTDFPVIPKARSSVCGQRPRVDGTNASPCRRRRESACFERVRDVYLEPDSRALSPPSLHQIHKICNVKSARLRMRPPSSLPERASTTLLEKSTFRCLRPSAHVCEEQKIQKPNGGPIVLLCVVEAFLLQRASRSRFTGMQQSSNKALKKGGSVKLEPLTL